LALAQFLKNDFDIIFFCKEIPSTIEREFKELGFSIEKIEREYSFFSNLYKNQIVVLDGYEFDYEYQKQIKAIGCKLVCIDDLHDGKFAADLIINHSPFISPQNYNGQPYTQFALGLDYALLRLSFLEQAKKERKFSKFDTLLISFGGSDPKNLTQKTLESVLNLQQFKKIILITGPSYQMTDSFRNLISHEEQINHLHGISEKQMLEAMLEAEFAIVPASGILLEAIAAKCIIVSGFYVENQKYLYRNLLKANSFFDAGNFEEGNLIKAISEAFLSKKRTNHQIDGQSSARINKLFFMLKKETELSLRKAEPTDVDVTFRWTSDQEIRKYSFQQHTITEIEHSHWFFNKLNEQNCFYYILEKSKSKLGSVRFDIKNSEALISFLIDPLYHGKGFGQIILKKGIETLCNEKTQINLFRKLIGFVMKDNISSIKSFERLGFIKYDLDDKFKFEKINE
jgi:UDP-2,4-diacetamido-2,4,6-trideoxy-beta-L-altropyranose hydrolase